MQIYADWRVLDEENYALEFFKCSSFCFFSPLFNFLIVNTIQNIKDISFNKIKMFRIYNDELRLNENFEIAEEATLTVFGRI